MLKRVFESKSIAIIGAFSKSGRIGYEFSGPEVILTEFIKTYGFKVPKPS